MQNLDRKIRVAITQGNTNGVGYETIFNAFAELDILEVITPIIYGNRKVMEQHAAALGVKVPFFFIENAAEADENKPNFLNIASAECSVELGKDTEEAEEMERTVIKKALDDYANGAFDVLVTAPSAKDKLSIILDKLTEHIRDNKSESSNVMDLRPMRLYCNGSCYATSMAGYVNENVAKQSLSEDTLVERVTMLQKSLKRDYRIDNPRIAILSFNDNSSNTEGSAEKTTVDAAVSQLVEKGIQVFGPYPTDTFFNEDAGCFDGILAMHHSQIKVFVDDCETRGGCITVSGLPIVLAKPLISPCFNIAGKNLTEPNALFAAIFQAVDAFRSRFYYDQPFANPLPKMYHERKEDGDKSRFTVKTKPQQ